MERKFIYSSRGEAYYAEEMQIVCTARQNFSQLTLQMQAHKDEERVGILPVYTTVVGGQIAAITPRQSGIERHMCCCGWWVCERVQGEK